MFSANMLFGNLLVGHHPKHNFLYLLKSKFLSKLRGQLKKIYYYLILSEGPTIGKVCLISILLIDIQQH